MRGRILGELRFVVKHNRKGEAFSQTANSYERIAMSFQRPGWLTAAWEAREALTYLEMATPQGILPAERVAITFWCSVSITVTLFDTPLAT